MTKFQFVVNLEVAENKGEDDNLIEYFERTQIYLMGVFDGLGGRSAGYGGQTGGRIASEIASKISKEFFKQWNGKITSENAIELQKKICQALKKAADDNNMRTTSSRLKGSLIEHKLCTTIALASIPKQQTQDKIFEANLAWMGDSRIYFLSPTKGLQQLTKDDLVTSKDAFEMLRQDPPMSQYLTADINPKWQIHFQNYRFEEAGCFLACTDGCFQYFSAPWEFERLLLDTLFNSKGTTKETNTWEDLIEQKYTEIKQDDVSLIIYAAGFNVIKHLKKSYQERLKYLQSNFIADTNNYDSLKKLWENYRIDYEYYLQFIQDIPPISHVTGIEDKSYIPVTPVTIAIANPSTNNLFEQFNELSKQKADEEVKKLYDRANYCYEHSQFQEARKLCNQALQIRPDEINPKYLLGLIYYELAEKEYNYQKKNQFLTDAAFHIKEVINRPPEKSMEIFVEAYQILGGIYYKLKDWRKSVEFYEDFFKCEGSEKYVNSTDFDQHLEFFVASLIQSRVEQCQPANTAIQFCLRIINSSSILPYGKKPSIYYFMASLQEIKGEFNAALNSLEILLELDLYSEYRMERKAKEKHQNILNKLNNRRY
ncbi:TPR repeat-containing protein [Anabaena sp. 90]|nr:TPR repeat-containing protein [Anabaena sp. 90]